MGEKNDLLHLKRHPPIQHKVRRLILSIKTEEAALHLNAGASSVDRPWSDLCRHTLNTLSDIRLCTSSISPSPPRSSASMGIIPDIKSRNQETLIQKNIDMFRDFYIASVYRNEGMQIFIISQNSPINIR